MKIFLLIRIVAIVVALLFNNQLCAQVVRYRSIDGAERKLHTATEVDTFVQVMNRRGRFAGIAFKSLVRNTISRPDTIIYEYTLMGTHTAAALQERQKNLDNYIGQQLPGFILPNLHGKLVNSRMLRGQPLVLTLWFTTCGPCIAEMPTLNRIMKEKAQANVIFIAMTFDSNEQVKLFLKKQSFDFEQIAGAKQYCSQFDTGYPVTFFVDRNGFIKKVLGGIAVEFDPVSHKQISADDKEFYVALRQIE